MAILGGVGGAFPMRKIRGVTAVEMMPSTRIYTRLGLSKRVLTRKLTDCLVSPTRGLINWPMAPPIGLAMNLCKDEVCSSARALLTNSDDHCCRGSSS